MHKYVYDKVNDATNGKQTPQKHVFQQEGLLFVTRNPQRIISEVEAREQNALVTAERPSVIQTSILASYVLKNICPILEDLGHRAIRENLHEKATSLVAINSEVITTPVVLLGRMGSGKTTLMNAILGQMLGRSGGGKAQSAAALIAKHHHSSFRVTATYITFDELFDILKEIHLTISTKNLSKRPDELTLSREDKVFLSNTIVDISSINEREIGIDDLNAITSEKINLRKLTKSFATNEENELIEFVKQHTNSRGDLWAITQEVEVEGPFPGLKQGVVIMDVPGLGDLNENRRRKIWEAVRLAEQTLIVVDERGIDESMKKMLAESHFISHLLTNPDITRIMFVGIKLDNIDVDDDELDELNLEYDSEPYQIVEAKFARWTSVVREQWHTLLRNWELNVKVSGKENYSKVNTILANTSFVPCSPLSYLQLTKRHYDRLNTVNSLFPGEIGESLEATGIPKVRMTIERLAEGQQILHRLRVGDRHTDLVNAVKSSCNPLVKSLLQEIALTERTKNGLEIFLLDLKEIINQNSYYDFQDSKDVANEGLKLVAPKMQTGWESINESTFREVLAETFAGVSFQTFKAAFVREGVFSSKGKNKLRINIPVNMSTYIAEPASNHIIDEVMPDTIAELNKQTQQQNKNNKFTIFESLSRQLGVSPDNIGETFQEQIDSNLNRFFVDAEMILNGIYEAIDSQKGLILVRAYDAIGYGLGDLMKEALKREGEERGARNRVIAEFSKLGTENKQKIIDQIAERLVEVNNNELSIIIDEGQKQLNKQYQLLLSSLTEYIETLLHDFDKPQQKELATKLKQHLDAFSG